MSDILFNARAPDYRDHWRRLKIWLAQKGTEQVLEVSPVTPSEVLDKMKEIESDGYKKDPKKKTDSQWPKVDRGKK